MIINDCYDYLVHLVFCAIHDRIPQKKPEGFSYEDVLRAGIRHDLANFAYPGILKAEEKPEKDILDRWQQRYLLGIRRNAEQMDERDRIICALHEKDIATLEMQGTVIKSFYPSPDLRNMGDIDIIVEPEKLGAASAVMQELGYTVENPGGAELICNLKKTNVEIHTDFFQQGSRSQPVMNTPFNYATEINAGTARVSATSLWMYHVLHTLKHYRHEGIGIRRILDLYYVKKAIISEVDENAVNKTLAENDMMEPLKDLICLSEYWFEGKEPERELSGVIETVKKAGTQGKRNLRIAKELGEMTAEGKKHVKLHYLRNKIFMSKEDIYSAYPYCREHKLPTGLCRIYRAGKILSDSRRRKNLKAHLKDLKKTDTEGKN